LAHPALAMAMPIAKGIGVKTKIPFVHRDIQRIENNDVSQKD
jgi:hypothetical protein